MCASWSVPDRNFSVICGNGLREGVEQCDCLPNCAADPCCNGTSCRLFDFAVCSNDQPCCTVCQALRLLLHRLLIVVLVRCRSSRHSLPHDPTCMYRTAQFGLPVPRSCVVHPPRIVILKRHVTVSSLTVLPTRRAVRISVMITHSDDVYVIV